MKVKGPCSEMEMLVTWGDCDAAGISYYARYFDWFTNARMQLLREYGFPYMTTFHNNGISLVCLSANCQYKKLVYPDEKVVLHTCLETLNRTKLSFTYQIRKQTGLLVAEGETLHAYVDREGRPFDIKKRFPELWWELINKSGTTLI